MRFGIEMETISKLNINDLTRKISEILPGKIDENTHAYHAHNMRLWGIEVDGSIHGDINFHYGAEIITPPLKIHELGDLRKVLESLKGNINANQTCGLHVHVEIEDVETLKKVLRIWRKFEDEILASFPLSRRNNRYCKKIKSLTLQRMLTTQYNRYYQVNCQKWPYTGTIEFRGHSGTVNYNKIKRWLLFCLAICRKAKDTENDDLSRELRRRNINIWSLIGENGKTKKYFDARTIHFIKEEKRCAA